MGLTIHVKTKKLNISQILLKASTYRIKKEVKQTERKINLKKRNAPTHTITKGKKKTKGKE